MKLEIAKSANRKNLRRGFSLIEMLIVIGIVAVLVGASVGAYSKISRSADRTRAQELVSNVATALTALYQREGQWPKKLLSAAESDNILDANAALVLAQKKYLSLAMNDEQTKLIGYDRLGIVTPWATAVIKSRGKSVDTATKVGSYANSTVLKHTVRFAVDDNGDGFTEVTGIEGYTGETKVRATACVWCCSREGSLKYKDIVRSWTDGQAVQ